MILHLTGLHWFLFFSQFFHFPSRNGEFSILRSTMELRILHVFLKRSVLKLFETISKSQHRRFESNGGVAENLQLYCSFSRCFIYENYITKTTLLCIYYKSLDVCSSQNSCYGELKEYHCVKSVRIWSFYGPHFSLYSVRMRENAGKMRTRITPNTGTFYAVCLIILFYLDNEYHTN